MYGNVALLGVICALLSSGSASNPSKHNELEKKQMTRQFPKSRSSELARIGSFDQNTFKDHKELGKPDIVLIDEIDMEAHKRGDRVDPHEWHKRHNARKALGRLKWKGDISSPFTQSKKPGRHLDGARSCKHASLRNRKRKRETAKRKEDVMGEHEGSN